jgi:xanthine dehydrogenase accessory factor
MLPSPLPDQIPEIALSWHQSGRVVWLATVIETWGSAPRAVGSQMVVDSDGAMMGSVSGGCVEGAVVAEVMAGGQARVLTFGVADEDAFAVGLACGGSIRVLIEPVGTSASAVSPTLLGQLVAARRAAQPVALVTDLSTFSHKLVAKEEDPAIDRALIADASALQDQRFLAVHNPPLRLIVLGAVQIAQHLLPMARALGHQVTLIDPRSAFGSAARFPDEPLVDAWPDEALPRLGLNNRCALVTLTHDAKLDDPAIAIGLRSPVYYIGCLGSKRTHAKRLERLADLGFRAGEMEKIHAPAGLDIGAKSPAEIALSIMAEITQVLRKGG